MIPPTYTTVDERFVVKRRARRKSGPGDEPAITILPPEPSMVNEFYRSPSPGVYKAAPTKAARSKSPSSFVILGEMLSTPVQSRPASPSGRVSPFRGHGFKTPATSRPPSPEPKPETKPAPKKPPARPRVKTDIGLPPKSPKKVKPRPVRAGLIQKTNLGVDKPKPNKTPRPSRKPLVPAKKNDKSAPAKADSVREMPKVDLDKVTEALNSLSQTRSKSESEERDEQGMVTEVDVHTSDASKSEVEDKDGEKEVKRGEEKELKNGGEKEVKKGGEKEMGKVGEKEEGEGGGGGGGGERKEKGERENGIEKEKSRSEVKVEDKEIEKKESGKLIPCYQPDKCHIAPPTMASPSPIITSGINAPSTLTKTTESIESSQASTVTTTSLNAISSAVTISGNLARKSQSNKENGSVLAPNPPKEETKAAAGAAQPDNSDTASKQPEAPLAMPPHSHLPLSQTKKESTNSVHGEVLSTSNLIKVDSELELLSANNLRESPPRRQPNPAWNDGRLTNGSVPNGEGKKSKFRAFLSSIWALIKYILCCRCIIDRCRRAACCSGKCGSCCSRPGSLKMCCCVGGNCCKCRKPKCCEGSKCCKSKNTKQRKCCAKRCCSCKDCCFKIRNCCSNCGRGVSNICRSLFCLNTMCCQGFLRRSCKSCHKLKCCQGGGCCSCFNPSVRRGKLDKRGSTQSKSEKEKLDPVLVEHVSLMKAAIPVLPSCLAMLCLILNLVFPGSGTLMSGIFCLCFGKARFSVNDTAKNRMGSFCVNLIIGIAQLFTIVFCLVGWGWSIWWGVIMYRLARKQRRIRLAEKSAQEAKNSGNQNHVDVEKG